jgi:hypothetical protein
MRSSMKGIPEGERKGYRRSEKQKNYKISKA